MSEEFNDERTSLEEKNHDERESRSKNPLEKYAKRSFIMRKLLSRTRQRPRVLSEEELKQLKEPATIKQILAILLAILGLSTIIWALWLFLSGTVIDWLIITYVYQEEDVVVNISPLFSIFLTYVGLWLVSRYSVNRNLLRENTTYIPHLSLRREPIVKGEGSTLIKIRSFASSRMFSAIILLIMVFAMALKFGVKLTEENHLGSWFVLGGPTLFFPTSFFPAIISIGLVGYVFLSSSVITFSRTEHFYCIEEYRVMAPWKTEIPIQDVKAIRVTNANTGPKFLWVVIFVPQIYYLYTDAFHLLLNPLNFGNAFMNGTVYLISGTVQLIVLLILLLKTQTMLEIATDEKYYELQFAPPAMMPIIRNAIEELFGIPALTEHTKKYQLTNLEPNQDENDEDRLNKLIIQDWTQLVFGFALFMTAFLSQISSVYLGEFSRLIFYMFGIIYMVRGYKSDFSSPRSKMVIFHNKNKNELYIRREWAWLNEVFKFTNISKEHYSMQFWIRKLDFWDVLASILIPFALGFSSGLTVPYAIPGTPSSLFPLLHFGISLIIILFQMYVLISPAFTLKLNTPSIKYQVRLPGVKSSRMDHTTKNVFQRTIELIRQAFSTQKREFLLRIIMIGAIFLGSAIWGMLSL